ncbi:MAG: hypothetical protein NVSMB30_06920 [Hymenobacter sp.]
MKNFVLAATAALVSFAASAQSSAPVVAGRTPANGRAYGQAVSAAAQSKNDYKKYDRGLKPLTHVQKDAYKDQREYQKNELRAQKDVYKDQREYQKDLAHDQKDARKDFARSARMSGLHADRGLHLERAHGARGEHARGSFGHDLGHSGGHKK